ncbi:cell division protein FtsX [Subtercola boreus]|uniref:Cell division protein FtsX n=1 Tax=Subtercola boreus TaxID=120213 RepID=A0A3E0WE91_9MICO|nr:cell division protein FtsX [Subtercola boreus]RFA22305.1 cell division protein FtsX [Subtercola boreus]RFA28202.1 cell division protein FtsX [Subtercola boreus]
MTAFVGSVVEAWAELRIHRTRVLLSLVGVAVAVCALTSVIALGNIAQQATVETSERSSGRPATLYVSAYTADGSPPPATAMDTTWNEALVRYGVQYASRVTQQQLSIQFIDGVSVVNATLVDPPYGVMHRVEVQRGAWFAADDATRLAPALIVNDIFYARLGSPDLGTHPTVSLVGAKPVTAVIVGVTAALPYEVDPSMMMLNDSYAKLADQLVQDAASQPYSSYEMWVPPSISGELTTRLQSDFSASLGDGATAQVNRQDYAAYGDDPFLPIKLMISGVAVLVLVLGALGLVNISLVTVRQRIQEIGIRRSFGATASRVFFAVMMESVVATVAAGVAGVMLSILILKSPWVEDFIAQGVTDVPPFPLEAAVLGLAAATVVGAIAGLLPALVAVRVKVIDAIRY